MKAILTFSGDLNRGDKEQKNERAKQSKTTGNSQGGVRSGGKNIERHSKLAH